MIIKEDNQRLYWLEAGSLKEPEDCKSGKGTTCANIKVLQTPSKCGENAGSEMSASANGCIEVERFETQTAH